MTDSEERRRGRMPGWGPALGVLLAVALVGPYLGGAARGLFIVACGAAGWFAWRRGPAAHVEATLLLFVFTPLARRVVDAAIGFDPGNLMIVGPLVAIFPALPGALQALDSPPAPRSLWPVAMVGVSAAWALALTILHGEWTGAARECVKWFAPLLYGLVLMQEAKREDILNAAAGAFAFILPVIGLYGVAQYVNPADWDIYWMKNATILSAGSPEPYGVRVFSTMNGPASFATYTAVGLLLVWFRGKGRIFLALATPAALALFLSLYRTAWLAMLAAIFYPLLFASTRGRSVALLAGLAGAVVIAATLTPFGDVIADRFATLSRGANDDSARERIEEYLTLWNMPDSSLIGSGFVTTDVGSAGAMGIDGTILACWLFMGIVFGLICLAGLIWIMAQAMGGPLRDGGPSSVLLGALGLFFLVQTPLAAIAPGEAGFLFWTFMSVAMKAPPRAKADVRRC